MENYPLLQEAPLGKKVKSVSTYSAELLFPIPRTLARDKLGILSDDLPFDGVDIWNGYEISWLNPGGKPQIALGEFYFPCSSPCVVESKSFKLYLHSLTQSTFASFDVVKETLTRDLTQVAGVPVRVELHPLSKTPYEISHPFSGICLDDLEIETDLYHVSPHLLKAGSGTSEETVFSNLLKSNCLMTGQPDWGSILIRYCGPKIDHGNLLKYLISYRTHPGFAEHCVEQIYHDLMLHCRPQRLTVYARYTRRGGLDINPFRSNFEANPENLRHLRQ